MTEILRPLPHLIHASAFIQQLYFVEVYEHKKIDVELSWMQRMCQTSIAPELKILIVLEN